MTLRQLYTLGGDGRLWYDGQRDALWDLFGPERGDMMLGFLAATSPRATLRSNVTKALQALDDWESGRPWRPGTLPAHAGNLTRAAQGLPLSGPKVNAFHRALTGDPTAVVVDVWMARIYGVPENMNLRQLRDVQARVTRLADSIGDEPRRVQAALWCGYKRHIEGPTTNVADYATLIQEAFYGPRP